MLLRWFAVGLGSPLPSVAPLVLPLMLGIWHSQYEWAIAKVHIHHESIGATLPAVVYETVAADGPYAGNAVERCRSSIFCLRASDSLEARSL